MSPLNLYLKQYLTKCQLVKVVFLRKWADWTSLHSNLPSWSKTSPDGGTYSFLHVLHVCLLNRLLNLIKLNEFSSFCCISPPYLSLMLSKHFVYKQLHSFITSPDSRNWKKSNGTNYTAFCSFGASICMKGQSILIPYTFFSFCLLRLKSSKDTPQSFSPIRSC